MGIQRLTIGLSQKIIIQFVIAIIVVMTSVIWNFDFIDQLYFQDQQTSTGKLINSAILALLIFGLAGIVMQLIRYMHEEQAITLFLKNIELRRPNLAVGLPGHSLMAKRHNNVQLIMSANGQVNHSALAAMLTADESTRLGLIRFINNILILTGVFGTIVSLSIALLGASDLIDSATLGGMGLVIHGMSTALSTTITAILSYLLLGYFYTRLNDVQTHLLSRIEHLTTVYLLPSMVKTPETIVYEMDALMQSIHEVAIHLKLTQETYQASALALQETIHASQQQALQFTSELDEIKLLLREGFRLPASALAEQH